LWDILRCSARRWAIPRPVPFVGYTFVIKVIDKAAAQMAKKLSRYFGIPAARFKRTGVFNALIGIDNKLFVDPTLLKDAKTPEFKETLIKPSLSTVRTDKVMPV
jgi:hypothetical protein